MVQIVKNMKRNKVITVVNNATFSATVTGSDFDMNEYGNILITYKTGTATTSPTLDIKFQIKDSNGNYIDHTSLLQVTAAGNGYEQIFDCPASTGRIVCTYGGTGNFATTTVEVTLSK